MNKQTRVHCSHHTYLHVSSSFKAKENRQKKQEKIKQNYAPKKKGMEKVQINRQGKLIIHAIVTLKIFIYQASRLCTQQEKARETESEKMDFNIIIWNSRHGKQKHQNGNEAKKKIIFHVSNTNAENPAILQEHMPYSLCQSISHSSTLFLCLSHSAQASPIYLRLIRCSVMLFLHFKYFAQYLIQSCFSARSSANTINYN